MTLLKPNGSLRPVAVGETIHRPTGEVAVDVVGDAIRDVVEAQRGYGRQPAVKRLCMLLGNGRPLAMATQTRPWFWLISGTRVTAAIGTPFLLLVRVHLPSQDLWAGQSCRPVSALAVGGEVISRSSKRDPRSSLWPCGRTSLAFPVPRHSHFRTGLISGFFPR